MKKKVKYYILEQDGGETHYIFKIVNNKKIESEWVVWSDGGAPPSKCEPPSPISFFRTYRNEFKEISEAEAMLELL